ncbi:MAG: TerC family protein [Methylocella sp.]
MDPPDTTFLIALLQIIWIDIVLSDDNAVVIALAARSLPERQRRWAIALGAGAAVLLRIVLTLSVVQFLATPFIKIAGGALLLIIAIRLARENEYAPDVAPPTTIWACIRIIVLADAIMSVDNVLAVAAAAKGSHLLIIFGLVLSIPLIVFGSTLLIRLLDRFPALVWAGAALLGWIAGDLIGSDPALAAFLRTHAPGLATWWFAPAGAAFVLIAAWLLQRLSPPSS